MSATERKPVDVLAVLQAAVAQPRGHYDTDDGHSPVCRKLAQASDPQWEEQLARARQQDRDFTMTMAGIGRSNPDRDGGLCAVQREHMRAGVEDVLIHKWLRGWAVRTDWADSHRVFVGYGDDPTEAITAALEWQQRAPDRRGVRMYGSDYLAALARVGGA